MKTRCPCCGVENSLDALIANDDARNTLWLLSQAGGDLTKLTVQYLGLFRPAKTSLTYSRMNTLLNELLPDMQAGRIARSGIVYEAPKAAWLYAFGEVLARRNTGSLNTPLKSHGYLYEVIAGWQGQAAQVVDGEQVVVARQSKASQMVNGLHQLEAAKYG